MHNFEAELDLDEALRLKRAEIWLEVGRPILALQQVWEVGESSWCHPWAVRILEAICPAAS